jgi:hypothetical protein
MSLGHGIINVELDGKHFELKPTLLAMKKIQTRFGGLRGALESIGQLNVEHIAFIVAAASGAKQNELNDIEETVFNEGVASATEKVVPFITSLMNPKGDASEKK